MNSSESEMVGTHCHLVGIYNYLGDGHLSLLLRTVFLVLTYMGGPASLLAGIQDCVSREGELSNATSCFKRLPPGQTSIV